MNKATPLMHADKNTSDSAAPPDGGKAKSNVLLFESNRALTLRLVTLVCLIPVPLTLWLVSLNPHGWQDTPLGPDFGWIVPICLVALSLVLPLSLFLMHDRYVLRLERSSGGTWKIETLLLWGKRTREFTSDAMAKATVERKAGEFRSSSTVSVSAPYLRVRLRSGQRLLLDLQGSAPHGWDAMMGIFDAAALPSE